MRELLLEAEAYSPSEGDENEPGFVDLQQFLLPSDPYQIYLMKDAGWIEGTHSETGYFRITSVGHDYIDATRDRGIWEKTKTAVSESGGSFTLELVRALAFGFAKKQLEDRTGLEL